MTSLPTSTEVLSPTNSLSHHGMTAEAFVRNLGGTIEFRKTYSVARFRTAEDKELFVKWLDSHSHERIAFQGALVVAYRPRQVRLLLTQEAPEGAGA